MEQVQVYLSDILHIVAQWLLAPDIILLLAFIGYALFCIGSLIVEAATERRHFKVVMPKFLNALMEAGEKDVPSVIEESGLLKRQKQALTTVFENRALPGDALMALVKREVEQEESRYDSITGRNNTAARVAPMLGLMGTLIPLGPGIEALGRADTAALSSSLLVAFDTTVAGLVVAAVCLVVGKIRGNWYDDYLSALDAAMATMIEKVEGMRVGARKVVLFVDGQEFELSPSVGASAAAAPSVAVQQPAESPVEAGSVAGLPALEEAEPGFVPELEPAPEPEPVVRFAPEAVAPESVTPEAVAPGLEAPESVAPEPAETGLSPAGQPEDPQSNLGSLLFQEAVPAHDAQPEKASEPELEPAIQPVIEPKQPVSLFFEPTKDPLADDAGTRQ